MERREEWYLFGLIRKLSRKGRRTDGVGRGSRKHGNNFGKFKLLRNLNTLAYLQRVFTNSIEVERTLFKLSTGMPSVLES
jgi:hypothetical protein